MGSLKSRAQKFDVPGEPGEWMAFRRLSERELQARADLATDAFGQLTDEQRFQLALGWIEATLAAWSYEEACTIDMVREYLDRPTLVWAFLTTMRHSHGMETFEEKKADSPGSTASLTEIPAPAAPTSG